jgi:hypothetical protein
MVEWGGHHGGWGGFGPPSYIVKKCPAGSQTVFRLGGAKHGLRYGGYGSMGRTGFFMYFIAILSTSLCVRYLG